MVIPSKIRGGSTRLIGFAPGWMKVAAVVLLGGLLLGQASQSARGAPSVPTGLVASSITATSFTLKWTASTGGTGGIAGYDVYSNGVFVGSPTTAILAISGLAPQTGYSMTVDARDKSGNVSTPSVALTVTTAADTTKPTAPAGLVASNIGITSFTLSWTASTDNVGVTGYNIYRSGTLVGSTTTATSFDLSGLAGNTKYSMTVKATDSAGNLSNPSASLAVTTLPAPPSVPTGLVGSSITATSFTLKWTASAGGTGGIAGYDVYSNGVLVGSPTTTMLAISGLAPLTGYSMTVDARDTAGNISPVSAALTVTTAADTTKPTAPTGLLATNVGITSFTLSWMASTDNVGVTGYNIYRGGTLVGSTTTATSFDLSGLTGNTKYSMTVRAMDAASNLSNASAALAVTTLPAPPSTPIGLVSSSITATSFTLKWTASTGGTGGIVGYDVYRNGVLVGSPATTTLAVSGLTPLTGYSMTVDARDTAGNISPASAALMVTTAADTTKPTAPTSVVASNIAVTSFILSWTASTDNVGVTGYNVYRSGTLVGSTTTATSFDLSGLTGNTKYSMTVKATDAAGNLSNASAALAVTTLPAPPSTPNGLVASSITATSFTLKWTASTGGTGGIAAYDVYCNGVLVGSPSTPKLAITGLTPLTSYSMTVDARDKAGNVSVASAALAVTTVADTKKPTAPTSLSASNIGLASFTLSWTASTDNVGVGGYNIYANGVLVGTSTSTSFDLTGLASGAKYKITVKAKDAAGNLSGASATLQVITAVLPAAPTGLAAASITTTSFTLTWTASSGGVGGIASYNIFCNGASIGSSATTTFAVTGLVPATTYILTVVAVDGAGNASMPSAGASITTNPVSDQGPSVAITSPLPSSVFTLPATLAITAVASDSVSAITSVEFFQGAKDLGAGVLSAPDTYSLSVPLVANPGIAFLTAQATDSNQVTTVSAPVAVQLVPGLPYTTDFESSEGYTLGSLNGQFGWAVTSGTATVVDANAASGTQSVALEAGPTAAQVNQEFGSGSPNPSIVFVDFMAQPATGADPSTSTMFDVDAARVAFVQNGAIGQMQVLNGDGEGAGVWQPVGPALPLDASGIATSWHRLTLRLDYTMQTWDFYVDGAMVACDLGFRLNTDSYLAFFTATGQTTATGAFDNFSAGATNPLFSDVNNDGIDDSWETAHGLSLSEDDRYLSPTGNGQTVVQDYISGIDPNDYFAGILPVLTSLVASNGLLDAQGTVSVRVTTPGGAVLPNAPLTFVTTTGASTISTAAGGTGSTQISVQTNAQGIASVYAAFTSLSPDVVDATAQSGGETTSISIPIAPPIVLLAAGADEALWQDATGAIRVWGRDTQGQLGDGVASDSSQMHRMAQIAGPLASAAFGPFHGLAVTTSGVVYSWGDNYFGQLGTGDTVSLPSPAAIAGLSGFTQVAAGDEHSLALRSDGTVWAWGSNQFGQLGNGTQIDNATPAQVPGLPKIVQIVAGARHSAAVAEDGSVWVWGSNEFGQLGSNAIARSSSPLLVANLNGVASLASGRQFLLALKTDGTVWAWGDNHAGQLGLGTQAAVVSPQQNMTLSGIVAVSAGDNHSVALDSHGAVWTWGANNVGQLGTGTLDSQFTPVALTLTGVKSIAAGRDHVVAVRLDSTLVSWGLNSYGQLGDPTAGPFSNVPVEVSPAND
jgi:chitodextrinase/alpha-tubulin suppressor-like RCC1 family protein